MRRLIALVALALVAGLGIVAGQTNYNQAQAVSHNLVIYSPSGARLMNTCHSWSFSDGRTDSSSCPSATCVIYAGQNTRTKCGWSDTDGVYIVKGFSLKKSVSGPDPTLVGCRSYGFWHKVSPTLFSGTATLYLWDCPAW